MDANVPVTYDEISVSRSSTDAPFPFTLGYTGLNLLHFCNILSNPSLALLRTSKRVWKHNPAAASSVYAACYPCSLWDASDVKLLTCSLLFNPTLYEFKADGRHVVTGVGNDEGGNGKPLAGLSSGDEVGKLSMRNYTRLYFSQSLVSFLVLFLCDSSVKCMRMSVRVCLNRRAR